MPGLLNAPGDATLFSPTVVYTASQLNKQLGRKSAKDSYWIALEELANDSHTSIIVWERDVPKRSVRYSSVSAIKIHESKPSASIFSLIAQCSPGNKQTFLKELHSFCDKTNEMFVYIMLLRHIRSLLMLIHDPASVKLPPWQLSTLKHDAARWKGHNIETFYEKLIGIEFGLKTGTNAYTIKQSIDILACYYL
jgi:hypothetical protein